MAGKGRAPVESGYKTDPLNLTHAEFLLLDQMQQRDGWWEAGELNSSLRPILNCPTFLIRKAEDVGLVERRADGCELRLTVKGVVAIVNVEAQFA